MLETLSSFGFVIPLFILVFSIIAHEVAHGVAAYIHGDTTAYNAGRLTLNPVPHIDFFGSIVLPLLSVLTTSYAVGYAKPVPYSPSRLIGKYAEFWVASAGVLTNFFLAFIGIIVFKLCLMVGIDGQSIVHALFLVIWTNVSLAVFNLIPISPFDGMSILASLFPSLNRKSFALAHNPIAMIAILIVAVTIFNIISPYLYKGIIAILQ